MVAVNMRRTSFYRKWNGYVSTVQSYIILVVFGDEEPSVAKNNIIRLAQSIMCRSEQVSPLGKSLQMSAFENEASMYYNIRCSTYRFLFSKRNSRSFFRGRRVYDPL